MNATAEHKSDRKAAWAALSDRGPHTAALPSVDADGNHTTVEFIVPGSNALIRAGLLPDRLMDVAVFSAAYPDGAEGYVADLAVSAYRDPSEMPKLAAAVKDGLELSDWLVSHMLVDPVVTPDEVSMFPPADIAMLLEFAERKRNTDAEGKVLPIVVLEDFARFPDGLGGAADVGVGGSDRDVVSVADSGFDGGDV